MKFNKQELIYESILISKILKSMATRYPFNKQYILTYTPGYFGDSNKPLNEFIDQHNHQTHIDTYTDLVLSPLTSHLSASLQALTIFIPAHLDHDKPIRQRYYSILGNTSSITMPELLKALRCTSHYKVVQPNTPFTSQQNILLRRRFCSPNSIKVSDYSPKTELLLFNELYRHEHSALFYYNLQRVTYE